MKKSTLREAKILESKLTVLGIKLKEIFDDDCRICFDTNGNYILNFIIDDDEPMGEIIFSFPELKEELGLRITNEIEETKRKFDELKD